MKCLLSVIMWLLFVCHKEIDALDSLQIELLMVTFQAKWHVIQQQTHFVRVLCVCVERTSQCWNVSRVFVMFFHLFCTLSLWIGHRYIVIESFHSSDFSMTGRQIHGVTQSVGFTRPRYMSLWTRDVQRYIPLRCISCTTHTHTIYTIRTSVCRKGELENVWWWRKIMGKYCIWIESSLSLLQIYGWLCHVGTQRQCVECECWTENHYNSIYHGDCALFLLLSELFNITLDVWQDKNAKSLYAFTARQRLCF